MKKLLVSLFCIVALVSMAQVAGNFQHNSVSLMNAQSLTLTNLIGITNIASSTSRGTNLVGTVFTNVFGSKVTTTATVGDKFNLLADFDLPATSMIASNTTAPPTLGMFYIQVTRAGASATNAINCVFSLLPDGVNESLDSAGLLTVTMAADVNATTPSTFTAPISALWAMGAPRARLRSISYTATAAGDSRIVVKKLSFNSFY